MVEMMVDMMLVLVMMVVETLEMADADDRTLTHFGHDDDDGNDDKNLTNAG